MQDRISDLMDKIAGQANAKAGELLETGRRERENRARMSGSSEVGQEAQQLEELAHRMRRVDAGHHGQHMASRDG